MHLNSTYILNIVVVHHPNDAGAATEVRRQLSRLHRQNKAYVINTILHTEQVEDEDAQDWSFLAELVQSADLVLVLLSEVAIMSALMLSPPLRDGVQAQLSGTKQLVPVILETCWWEDTPYKNLEALPQGGMPLLENPLLQEELFDEFVLAVQARILLVREDKKNNEETYKTVLAEADKLFEQSATQPALLRKALPLYREAVEKWREGYHPLVTVLETRVTLCTREINFYHYAEAAKAAHKRGDRDTAYFNCKDALQMREDAVIRRLYDQLNTEIQDEEMRALREPFDRHLKRGHDYFLNMEWEEAKAEYHQALDFYEEGFQPTRDSIQYKIETCHREATLEAAMRRVRVYYAIQDYVRVIDTLTEALRDINKTAYERMEHVMRLLRTVEKAVPYHDYKLSKWGYYHKDTKEVIIAPKYNGAFRFSENLAGVKKWEKWGFIDVEGNEIIPFLYDFVGHFHLGVAEVVRGKEMYFINHRGDRVEGPKVREIN